MDYDQAMEVLRRWGGRRVTVVAFVEPGVSLHPFGGQLAFDEDDRRIARAVIEPPGTRIAFPRATFHQAEWVAGQEDRGLSVVQGATRVDVFVEG